MSLVRTGLQGRMLSRDFPPGRARRILHSAARHHYRLFRNAIMKPSDFLCTLCGAQTSAPLKVPPGNAWVALVLAIPFVIPGVAYAVWRYTMKRTVCPTCGHAQLIPASSPLARTWRSAGWIGTQRPAEASPSTTSPDIRIDRIEQAIDAIAGEVDRIVQQQQRAVASIRNEREPTALLRDRGPVTPT
ncbi:MAG: hypothetical protein ABIT38_06005 [Gemmatimonadaceae bacterium]